MKKLDLSCKDKFHIAEYIYSYHHNILIRNDAYKLIDVLRRNELINNKTAFRLKAQVHIGASTIAFKLYSLLSRSIPKTHLNAYLKEYLK